MRGHLGRLHLRLHCWVRLRGDIFLSTQKIYHSRRCTISRNYHRRCCWDDLLGQNLLNDLRSWGAGLKPFILSLILLQCRGDAGGTLCGHYSGVKFINLGDKRLAIWSTFETVFNADATLFGYVLYLIPYIFILPFFSIVSFFYTTLQLLQFLCSCVNCTELYGTVQSVLKGFIQHNSLLLNSPLLLFEPTIECRPKPWHFHRFRLQPHSTLPQQQFSATQVNCSPCHAW